MIAFLVNFRRAEARNPHSLLEEHRSRMTDRTASLYYKKALKSAVLGIIIYKTTLQISHNTPTFLCIAPTMKATKFYDDGSFRLESQHAAGIWFLIPLLFDRLFAEDRAAVVVGRVEKLLAAGELS